MEIIIVTDIFGETESTRSLQSMLSSKNSKATTISPYQSSKTNLKTENDAYQVFLDECGHEKYAVLVQEMIDTVSEKLIIIGFSAGASAVWNAIGKLPEKSIKYFFGFYPAQIRNNLETIPVCPMTLVFPVKEQHFDLSIVVDLLSSFENIRCINTKYLHGFMNPLSTHYSESGSKKFTDQLNMWIKSE